MWAYQKLIKLSPEEDKWNLYYGSGVHEGIEHLIKGNTMVGAVEAACERMKKDGGTEQDMFDMAPAALEGWSKFFWPGFLQNWEPVEIEGVFRYQVGPSVEYRGALDLVARHRNDGRLSLTDWKTTGQYGGGDLGKNVANNEQLALYTMAWYRKYGEWPNLCGLGFLQKPKLKKLEDIIKRQREDPSLYFYKPTPVNPRFAQFAIAIEKSNYAWGKQALSYAQDYDTRGYEAISDMPASYGSCFKYGKFCGFHDGCSSGTPAHENLLAAQQQGAVQ